MITAPNDGARTWYVWSPAVSWLADDAFDAGWGAQLIELAPDDGEIFFTRLDSDGTSSVRSEVYPLLSGITGPVTAVAKHGDLLAIGQAEYAGGAGRVRIFEYDDDDEWEPFWTFVGAAGSAFGRALALDGDVLVVGAPEEGDCGAVHVYVRAEPWIDAQTIDCPSSTQVNAEFGEALAYDGGILAVGAPRLDRPNPDGAFDAGGVYIFRVGFLFFELETLAQPADASDGDELGSSLALYSWGENQAALLAGAPLADAPFTNSGQAYLYLDWGEWRRFSTLGLSEGAHTRFGPAVALGKHGAVVGAPRSDGNDVVDQGAVFAWNGILPLFYDGFDRGDTDAWSVAVP